MRSSLHSLLLFYHTDHLPFISILAFLLRTLLGLCAGSPCIYTMTHPVLFFNLNLLCSPWISLSLCTTLECTLSVNPCNVLRNRLLLRLAVEAPSLRPLKKLFKETLSLQHLRVYVCLCLSQA